MDIYLILTFIVIAVGLVVGLSKRYNLTYGLVLSIFVIFFMEILSRDLRLDLMFRPAYLTTGGENLYTILTSMFAHSDFFHIIGNVLFLFFLGTALESRIGKPRFAAVYFVSGLAGIILAALTTPPNVFLLGASGAISGLMGALLVLYPSDEIPMLVWFLFLPKVKVVWAAASWFVFSVLLVILIPQNVSWQAHVGGFLGGMAVGWILASPIARRTGNGKGEAKYFKLEPLATTPELKNALEMIKKEEQKDIRRAWMEYFVERAKCPNCQEKMLLKGNTIICPCSFEIDLR